MHPPRSHTCALPLRLFSPGYLENYAVLLNQCIGQTRSMEWGLSMVSALRELMHFSQRFQWRSNCPCRPCNAGGGARVGGPCANPHTFFYRDVVVGYASSCLWTQNNLRGLLNGSRQWVMNSIAAKFSVIFPKCFVIHTRTWHRITSHSFTERIQLWCSLSDAFLVQLVTLASSFKSEIAQLSSAKDFAHLLHWLQHSPKLYLPCSCFLPCQ